MNKESSYESRNGFTCQRELKEKMNGIEDQKKK